jgi:hypothetical protein
VGLLLLRYFILYFSGQREDLFFDISLLLLFSPSNTCGQHPAAVRSEVVLLVVVLYISSFFFSSSKN